MTHVLVFLEQDQVLRKVLPDELFDDFLFDARVQHVSHQAGVPKHVTGASRSLCVGGGGREMTRLARDANIYEQLLQMNTLDP